MFPEVPSELAALYEYYESLFLKKQIYNFVYVHDHNCCIVLGHIRHNLNI